MASIKAVICAAGQGKRLFPLTKNTPKALLPIGEKTFLEYILDTLSACGVEDVLIIVGYKADDIKEKIGTHYGSCSIEYARNDDFATTNNMYSLWSAKNYISRGMIFLNADTLFHSDILKKIIESPHKNGFAMSSPIRMLDDAMKVHVKEGRLVKIGKEIKEEPHGEAFGIYKISSETAKKYFEIAGALIKEGGLEEDGDRGDGGYKNASFVVPLQKMADEVPIMAISSEKYPWVEVDTPEDYDIAKKMVKQIMGE